MNLMIFGDSIAWGAWDQESGWVARLRKYCDNLTISSQFSTYHSVYNLSISGDTTRSLLGRIESELTSRLDSDTQNIVLVAIGVNDSQISLDQPENEVPMTEFENNMRTIVEIAQSDGSEVVFLGLFPVGEEKVNPIPWRVSHSYLNKEIERYNASLLTISQSEGVHFIDVNDAVSKLDYTSLLIDGVHPNDEGHQIIFELVKNYFMSRGLLL